jgi:hypothetical protein
MPISAPASPPPLRDGDRLTSGEFLRRWEAMPDLKHAELIDGVVYRPFARKQPTLGFPFVTGYVARCLRSLYTWLPERYRGHLDYGRTGCSPT